MSDTRQTNEQTMAAALAPFGWTCGPEFWQRYYSDPWVFNLANAVERLSRADELEAIVRDLAANGAHVMTVRERAKAWVADHPGAAEPERPAMCSCGHDLSWHSHWDKGDETLPCDATDCICGDFDRVSAHPVSGDPA